MLYYFHLEINHFLILIICYLDGREFPRYILEATSLPSLKCTKTISEFSGSSFSATYFKASHLNFWSHWISRSTLVSFSMFFQWEAHLCVRNNNIRSIILRLNWNTNCAAPFVSNFCCKTLIILQIWSGTWNTSCRRVTCFTNQQKNQYHCWYNPHFMKWINEFQSSPEVRGHCVSWVMEIDELVWLHSTFSQPTLKVPNIKIGVRGVPVPSILCFEVATVTRPLVFPSSQ